jgi:WD40 repeat protein
MKRPFARFTPIFASALALTLLALPSALAQTLYVGMNGGSVRAYNATTGAPAFNLSTASTTILASGDNLSVVEGHSQNYNVSDYDAATGGGPSLTIPLPVGYSVSSLTTSGNTLFVGAGPQDVGYVLEYDATTGGAPILSINTGQGVAFGPPSVMAVSNNVLYALEVTDTSKGEVLEFNATTGASLRAIPVTGNPSAMVLSGNYVFVSTAYGTVLKYDATTGALLLTISTGSAGAMAIAGNSLYVAGPGTNSVTEYDATTGASMLTISNGVSGPGALALVGNDLYVANETADTVTEYDATNGGAPVLSISTGSASPFNLAYSPISPVPEPASCFLVSVGLGLIGTFRRLRRKP